MQTAAYLVIIAANLVGGATFYWQDLALEGLPPATVIAIRTVIAALCAGMCVACERGGAPRFTPREHVRLAAIGIFAFATPLVSGIAGLRLSTVSNASVLILLEPVAILVFSWLLLGEHMSRRQFLGVALAIAGGFFVVSEGKDLTQLVEPERLRGNLLLALSGITWGLYTPLMKPIATRASAMRLTFVSMLYSLAYLMPAAAGERAEWRAGPELLPALGWTVLLALSASFAATAGWNWSLKHLSGSAIAPFVFLQPLTGTLLGSALRGESLSPAAIGGGLFIAAGLLAVIYAGNGAAATAASTSK